eukprot:7121625-Prymnesium_polylepis.1
MNAPLCGGRGQRERGRAAHVHMQLAGAAASVASAHFSGEGLGLVHILRQLEASLLRESGGHRARSEACGGAQSRCRQRGAPALANLRATKVSRNVCKMATWLV